MASYRFVRRQLIESKTALRFEAEHIASIGKRWFMCAYKNTIKKKTDKDSPPLEFVQIVRGYYRSGARSRSYITFMAREKPGELPVEYQAKCMSTLDGKRHPILCRPAPPPTPKPSDQNS
ncbi:unnamed protein product [Cochlearia groenlandica]